MLTNIEYMEIPYVEDGRGWTGCDCYGFVLLWYENKLGITIPDLNFKRNCNFSTAELEKLHDSFVKVDVPREHDLVLIRNDPDIHVGICLSEKSFIHMLHGVGGAFSELRDWKSQIVGYYRHKTRINNDT